VISEIPPLAAITTIIVATETTSGGVTQRKCRLFLFDAGAQGVVRITQVGGIMFSFCPQRGQRLAEENGRLAERENSTV
jgi:hypothetical protein